jgi:hypothetical protein
MPNLHAGTPHSIAVFLKTRTLALGTSVASEASETALAGLSIAMEESPGEAKRRRCQGDAKTLGWTILFALISLSGVVVTLAGQPCPFCLKTASFIFAALFLVSLLTRAVRGRAF